MKKLILFFLLAIETKAAVWLVDKSWDDKNEQLYSLWVHDHWTNDVFRNPNSDLHGLKTDCADATYTMRAYFAYLNQLPFSFHRFDGSVMDQSTSQFDKHKDPLLRFRAFLNYLYDVTSTYTLSLDTFPIPISRDYLVAGTVYVSPGIHSYQIIDLDEYGVPNTLSSTVPRDERILFNHYGFPFYVPQDFLRKQDGYRSFRKIKSSDTDEQYILAQQSQGDFILFQKLLIHKLSLKAEPFERRIRRIKGNLCFFSRERAVLVADAFVKHSARNGSCFGPAEFDDYSTYIRDKKLRNYFLEFKKMTGEPNWPDTAYYSKLMLLSVFLTDIPDHDCTVETSLPIKPIIRLSEIYQSLEAGHIIADPNASMAQRWGLEPYQPVCPIY